MSDLSAAAADRGRHFGHRVDTILGYGVAALLTLLWVSSLR